MARLFDYREAKQLLAAGRAAEALEFLGPFLNGAPEMRNLHGVALLRLGRYQEALRDFQQCSGPWSTCRRRSVRSERERGPPRSRSKGAAESRGHLAAA
jgi:hypothetical protein